MVLVLVPALVRAEGLAIMAHRLAGAGCLAGDRDVRREDGDPFAGPSPALYDFTEAFLYGLR